MSYHLSHSLFMLLFCFPISKRKVSHLSKFLCSFGIIFFFSFFFLFLFLFIFVFISFLLLFISVGFLYFLNFSFLILLTLIIIIAVVLVVVVVISIVIFGLLFISFFFFYIFSFISFGIFMPLSAIHPPSQNIIAAVFTALYLQFLYWRLNGSLDFDSLFGHIRSVVWLSQCMDGLADCLLVCCFTAVVLIGRSRSLAR